MLEPEKVVPYIRYFSHFCGQLPGNVLYIYYIRHAHILIYKAYLYFSRAKSRERLVPKQDLTRTLEILCSNPRSLPPTKARPLKAPQPPKTIRQPELITQTHKPIGIISNSNHKSLALTPINSWPSHNPSSIQFNFKFPT